MTTKHLWVLTEGKTVRCLGTGIQASVAQLNQEIRLAGKQGRWVRVRGLPLLGRIENLLGCCRSMHGSQTNHTESSQFPSPAIDAALCDLIAQIENYSDGFFDVSWFHLKEPELEALVVLLLKHWTEHLDGMLLGTLLLLERE